MTAKIRAATLSDLPSMVTLLMEDAEGRKAHNPALWVLEDDARQKVADAVTFALTEEEQPFRQKWLVAEAGGRLVGIIHTVRLPVPPIYAGKWGDPGLLMPETFVTHDAPVGTLDALIDAAEADLCASGAKILLSSFVCGDQWNEAFRKRRYEPLTLYFFKSGLQLAKQCAEVRTSTVEDIDEIVALSAENRSILHRLNVFWTPHPEADARFGNWMKRSLALTDRNMLVTGPRDALDGYVVAQPASRLHFPRAHDISATGVIDDFFHRQYADPTKTPEGGVAAQVLLQAAESSFAARGIKNAFVVCPAAWTSKTALLEQAGYETAMVWMIKR